MSYITTSDISRKTRWQPFYVCNDLYYLNLMLGGKLNINEHMSSDKKSKYRIRLLLKLKNREIYFELADKHCGGLLGDEFNMVLWRIHTMSIIDAYLVKRFFETYKIYSNNESN